MTNLVYALVFSIIVYLIYFFLIINNPKKLKKYIENGRETRIIKTRYNLDYNKLNHKMVANYFAIANSFMIGLLFLIVININNFILKILIAFIVFTFLTVILYLQIGKKLKQKEGVKCTITKK
jgi:hypothetical protein